MQGSALHLAQEYEDVVNACAAFQFLRDWHDGKETVESNVQELHFKLDHHAPVSRASASDHNNEFIMLRNQL